MKMKSLSWISSVLFGCAVALFTACDDDSDGVTGQGEVAIEITDAPVDDAEVKGVFVTVAEVKVNGQSIAGFTKQTIDLTAYQEGKTHLLGTSTMDAKTYGNIALILDLETDDQGNSPGCYVLTQDNAKFKLKSSATGKTDIMVTQTWKAVKDEKTTLVMDFDLRKSLRYSDDESIRYSFVSDGNLNNAVRLVTKNKAGTINGTFEEETEISADKIIVYAYKKGSFSASSETQGIGSSDVYFKNAVTSAEVKGSGIARSYTLAFLSEGEYELHFATYKENETTGEAQFESMLQSETSINGSVANVVKVNGSASVNISSKIKGTL